MIIDPITAACIGACLGIGVAAIVTSLAYEDHVRALKERLRHQEAVATDVLWAVAKDNGGRIGFKAETAAQRRGRRLLSASDDQMGVTTLVALDEPEPSPCA